MMKYTEMTAQQRQAEYAAVLAEYEKQKSLGLKLNMARGKPGREQLDMVTESLRTLSPTASTAVTTAMWTACPPLRPCLRRFWAASRRNAS